MADRDPLTARIKPGMRVEGADGTTIGTVADIEAYAIHLASDGDMKPSSVPTTLVEAVEGDRVIVRNPGGNAFGSAAG